MPMYVNLNFNQNKIQLEYSDNYSKTSESQWQYYRNEPGLKEGGTIQNLLGNSA